MNDKVDVEITVPEIEKKYDLFLPVNKKMGTIVKLLNKTINEDTDGEFPISETCTLYNAEMLEMYEPNVLLYNTNIRNGTRLVLLSKRWENS